jgi:osmotically-inducible protein OsmY
MKTLLAIAFLVGLSLTQNVQAQLFGATARRGAAARRAASVGAHAQVGSIRGNERFVRGNRQATDFIGTDTRDPRDFVGSAGSASGEVQAATEGLRIESAAEANEVVRSATQVRSAIYDPRLRVGFDFTPPSPEAMASRLADRLEGSPLPGLSGPVSVSVEGRTVTLGGEVASEHDRTLAGLLLLLEPGVSEVRNNLTVRPPAAASEPGPTALPGDTGR